MKFNFKAKTETGEVKEGIVEAISRDAAVLILQRNNLIPLSLTSENSGELFGFLRDIQKLWEGVSQKELMIIFRQLSTLIEARVPVVTSLRTISDQVKNRYLAYILRQMEDDIQDGASFSEALERHPQVFSSMVISMIRAGEVSGSLQRSIEFVADSIEKNYQLTSKVRGALYYPGFVMTVAFAVGFLVVTFILPKITVIIKEMNVPVPWYTSALMWLGDFMNDYWWAVLIVVLAGVGAFAYYIQSDKGRREWDIVVLKLPVFKLLAKGVYVTRFSENLGALLNGGIPVVKALMITGDVIGNSVYQQIILHAAEEVKTGGTMSTVFVHYPNEVPPIVAQMTKIGEETGTISKVLDGVARFYGQEVDTLTRNLTTLIEPILIVFLGIGVAILTVGVLLPIYNIAGNL